VTRRWSTTTKATAALTAALACLLTLPTLASAAFVAPPVLVQANASPKASVGVVVLGQPTATSQQVKDRLRSVGAKGGDQFTVIPAVAVELTGAQIVALAQDPAIRSITPDGGVHGQSVTSGFLWPEAADVAPLWAGAGGAPPPNAPAIAVVDSGVDPSKADFGNRIVASVNLAGNDHGNGNALGHTGDDDGHGTLVAGIAAGASSYAPGASPTSKIVSLRVVDGKGSAHLSDVIAAADWIFKNRFKYNVRVANFSVRSSFPDYALYDPLDAAVRNLWLTGTVVVTSAGNSGEGRMVFAPADDPFVITVGASDIADTVDRSDDGAASWTSHGFTAEGFAKPELSAPGRYMVGPVPAGSTLTKLFPARLLAPGYMWMSGTSFAAPVVSGIAAQILARHPDWTPDQVKGALMKTATTAPLAPPLVLGLGEVDGAAAAAVTAPPNPNVGLDAFVRDDGSGNPYFDGDAWNAYVATDASWTDAAWTDAAWTDAAWTDAAWTDAAWTDAAWTDAAWTDAAWTDAAWTDAAWTDAAWTDASPAP
jgi:serine protease AprX